LALKPSNYPTRFPPSLRQSFPRFARHLSANESDYHFQKINNINNLH
jgi:hypothetical protein